MKTKCISRELTEEQRLFFKVPPLFRTVHQITIGREYLVLGILFVVNSPVYGNTALFEIVDGRCSSFWETRFYKNGDITMWPSEFYEPYFHDDLSDGDPKTRTVFDSVIAKMRCEF